MNKILLPAVLVIILTVMMSMFFGIAVGAASLFLSVLIVFVLDATVLPMLPKMNFMGKHSKTVVFIVILIATAYTGGLALLPGLEGFTWGGITASLTGASMGIPIAPSVTATSASTCAAVSQGGTISDEIWGSKATVTINAYNKESNTPYSAAVDTTAHIVRNGQIATITDTTDSDMDSYSVGDIISVYGGDTTYYVDAIESICIDKAAFPLDLDAHAIVASTSLDIVAYDDTGASTLSTGTNSTSEDYDITMGADENAQFFLKQKVNAANYAYNFAGWMYRLTNEAEELTMLSSGFTETGAPKWANFQIESDDASASATGNITGGYSDVFVLPEPEMMQEWDTVKHEFNILTNEDPSTSTTFNSGSNVILCSVDAAYSRGDDGKIYLDTYQHNSDESDVGQAGDNRKPVGGLDCTVIELI